MGWVLGHLRVSQEYAWRWKVVNVEYKSSREYADQRKAEFYRITGGFWAPGSRNRFYVRYDVVDGRTGELTSRGWTRGHEGWTQEKGFEHAVKKFKKYARKQGKFVVDARQKES